MTSSPTIVTSPPLLWSHTELSAGGYFKIEYLYLFCQILYYFCQRFFTSTWGLPSERLYARALRHSFLYCFDRNLLFRSYGTSFIPFSDLPYTEKCTYWDHRTLLMAINVHGLSTETDSLAFLSNKPTQS